MYSKLKHMIFISKAQARKFTGFHYLGSVSKTHKHAKSIHYNELTYSLYLSPANSSGYEVCPNRSAECTLLCLNGSGNGMVYPDHVLPSRIKKTKLFFEQKELFVRWMIEEIKSAKKKADKLGYTFSVRLNNTSDISPLSFYIHEGNTVKNILQIFPDIQFYDYTKVPTRIKIMEKYKNYDVTFSYSGYNMNDCITMLNNNVRVAMVFKKVPSTYINYPVINGDDYDMRYKDPKNVIVGLKFKVVSARIPEQSKFVINI